MKIFFLFIEIFTIIFIFYVLIKKKELSVVYIPFYLFSTLVVDSVLPASVNYLITTIIIGYYFLFNIPFIFSNIFSVLISLYFSLLLLKVTDFVDARPAYFGVITLFLLIGIIPEIYKKYPRKVVFEELGNSSLLILILFVINVFFSTIFKFNPHAMYGVTTGVMFGNVRFAAFNILPLASFVLLNAGIVRKKYLYFLVFFISFFLIMVSLRRTVMGLTLLGSLILLFNLLDFQNLKKFLLIIFIFGLVSLVVIYNTGFYEVFIERLEARKLDEKELEEEQRFSEILMIYNDLFVTYDYSPWFGYRLFDSKGNYGKGAFGDRSLHTDLTTIIHSSGLIGLLLYLLMIFTIFYIVWWKTKSKNDYYQFFFIAISFATYFMTGRYTNTSSLVLLFLILALPICKNEKDFGKKIQKNRNLQTK